MRFRIVAGKYKNLKLVVPAGNRTHPMGERIRSAIFNSLGVRVTDATVLDVFAGTGALGLEAISRGARRVTLVESDKRAIKAIRENIASLELIDQPRVQLRPTSFSRFVLEDQSSRFDIIFADPPYDRISQADLDSLASLANIDATLILSAPNRLVTLEITGWQLVKSVIYAGARISYYSHLQPPANH